MRGATHCGLGLAVLFGAATAQAVEWTSEGPELGVVNDLTVDPTRPDTVYAATTNAGVWRSDDFGASWRRLTLEALGGAFRWVEPDRSDPQTLWAGDKPGGNSALLRSKDGGASWFVVAGPVKGELGRLHSTGVRVVFAPSDPKTIFVPSTNLHYRSVDGGANWISFRVPGQDAYAIAVDPTNPRRVYAGGRGDRYHISTSADGGVTWTPVGAGLPAKSFRQLLIHPERPTRLIGLIGFNELWMSDDAGTNFVPLPQVTGLRATAEMRLRLDPIDPDRLWMVGEGGLYRGDFDGNWELRSRGSGGWVAQTLAIDPRDGNRLLLGKAGDGVWRSDDGGASWRPSRQGLHAGYIERVVAMPGQPGLWAQSSTGLFRRLADGGWQEVRAPFSNDRAADPDGIVFDRHAPGVLLGHNGSSLWRSTDGGASWKPLPAPVKEPSIRQMMKGIVQLPQPDFRAIAQDPANPKRMYAGGRGREAGEAVFASADGGVTWQPSGAGIDGEIAWLLCPQSGVLLAVNKDRVLFRSADAAATWQTVAGGWPASPIRATALDPTAPGRVFVATEQGLYRSDDAGQSWARKAGGLEDPDVKTVLVTPSGAVLVGGRSGVYLSRDQGEGFAPLEPEPRLEFVQSLALGGEPIRLYVGTQVLGVQSTPWTEP